MRINWFCAIFGPHYSLCHENGFIWTRFSSRSHFHHERRDYSLAGKTPSPCCSSNPPSSPRGQRESLLVKSFLLWFLWPWGDHGKQRKHKALPFAHCYLYCSHLWGRDCSLWTLQGQLTGRVYQWEHHNYTKQGRLRGALTGLVIEATYSNHSFQQQPSCEETPHKLFLNIQLAKSSDYPQIYFISHSGKIFKFQSIQTRWAHTGHVLHLVFFQAVFFKTWMAGWMTAEQSRSLMMSPVPAGGPLPWALRSYCSAGMFAASS